MPKSKDPYSPALDWPKYLWQPIVFSALFFGIALGAVLYFVSLAADRENAQAVDNSNHLARTAIGTVREDMVGRVVDYAWWNDMVAQVKNGIEPGWAETNIGKYMQDEFGYSGSYVFDAGNETLYHAKDNPDLPAEGLQFLGSGGEAFLTALRATPTARSESGSSFVTWNGRVYLVAAGSITPETPTEAEAKLKDRPILVFFREMNSELMESLGQRFLLGGLRLGGVGNDGGGLSLSSLTGKPLATVIWAQDKPGDRLFQDLALRIGAVTLVLVVAAVALSFVWSRSAITANLAKSRFLAKMSHELLTPLNPIIGFSQAMSDQLFGPIAPRYRGYADDIQRSARHLQSVVQDVLDFSRIETGELGLQETLIELPVLVRDLPPVTVYRPSLDGEEQVCPLAVRAEIPEDLPRLVGDERRIRQILINVLSNAAKFSDGQELTLRANLIDGGAMRIEIQDKGIGIAPADIPKAFEPFVQLAPTGGRTRSRTGAGIGLSICRDLMNMHGGTLDLESDLGKGTTVIMTFPADRIAERRATFSR